jgi:hypothetical protein
MYNDWIDPEVIVSEVLFRTRYKGYLDEDEIFIAVNEAIDQIVTADNLVEGIVLLDMYNGKAKLPNGFRYPLQVAYRTKVSQKEKCNIVNVIANTCSTISENIIINTEGNCCNTCKKDVCSCEEKTYYPMFMENNYLKLSAKPVLAATYSKFMYGSTNSYHNNVFHPNSVNTNLKKVKKNYNYPLSYKCPQFQLVRPTSNYFFNLPNEVKGCNLPSFDSNLEYKIDNGIITINNIRGFRCESCQSCVGKSEGPCEYNYSIDREGHILLSFKGNRLNKNGFLLLPDLEYVKRAVRDYAIAYIAFARYSETLQPKHERYWMNTEQIANVSMRKAKGRFRTPTQDVWNQFILNHWLKRSSTINNEVYTNRLVRDSYYLPDQTINF